MTRPNMAPKMWKDTCTTILNEKAGKPGTIKNRARGYSGLSPI